MKIIIQLIILTLSLLLVNAHDDDQYCNNLFKQYKTFKSKCSPANITIDDCCDLTGFPLSKTPSAVYQIKSCVVPCKASPFTMVTTVTTGYCDMTTDHGGWIIIQRNKINSSVDFNKNWVDYEEGFGDLNTEFWYGLAAMHCLTQKGQWEMRLDYQKKDKTWSYYHYNQFSVGSASEEYPLTVGGFTGVGIEWLTVQVHPLNGMKFSTPDNDNDRNGGNCAASYKSGWWYNTCHTIHINRQPPDIAGFALFTEMKIRPKDCITQ